LGGDGAEGNQELVVNSLSFLEGQTNNLLNMVFTVFLEEL
jgi:hypothetical protein